VSLPNKFTESISIASVTNDCYVQVLVNLRNTLRVFYVTITANYDVHQAK